jgi:hypothetical protein
MSVISHRAMQVPNFLGIGAQKSGTTWLHRFLRSRPDVFVPKSLKELMYFDVEDRYRSWGPEGYAAYFAGRTDEPALGEVTPGYLWVSPAYPDWGPPNVFRQSIPSRVESMLGRNIKLVVILRNPIDRAISAFLHHRAAGRIPPEARISDYWNQYGITHIGFYAAHLSEWAAIFPRKHFFITTYDEFFSSSEKRSSLLVFLGAKPATGGNLASRYFNKGSGFIRDVNGTFDSRGHQIATPDEMAILRETYQPDALRLADEWALDLRSWRGDFPIARRRIFLMRFARRLGLR